MKVSTIAIGCDHAGYPYKGSIVNFLDQKDYTVLDFGTHSSDSVDYPDFVHPTAQSLKNGEAHLGILLCGSGNGVAMAANKHQNIRAALCWTNDIAALARQHNDANIICLPVRFISEELALEMVHTFISTKFEGGRHARRVSKIACR